MEQWLNTCVYGLAPAAVAWAAARGRLFDATWRGRIWGAALVTLAALLALPLLETIHVLPSASPDMARADGLPVGALDARVDALVRLPAVPVPGILLVAAWSSIAAWRVAALVLAVVRIRAARAAARPFPESHAERLPEWNAANDGRFTLVLSDRVPAPAMLGFGRPMVAVPAAWLERLSDEALDAVLLHELAHAERRDDLVDLAHQLLLAACWFHPASWWIGRRIAFEREAACDEQAARLTTTRRYARCLVTMAETMGPNLPRRALVAASVGRRRQLTRRIEQLLAIDARPTLARPSYLAAPVLAAIVALVAAVPALPRVFDVKEGVSLLRPARLLSIQLEADASPSAATEADRGPVMAPRRPRAARTDAGTGAAPLLHGADEAQETLDPVLEAPVEASAEPANEGSLASRQLIAHPLPAAVRPGRVVTDNVEEGTGTAASFRALGAAFSRAGATTGRWFSQAGTSVASTFVSE